MLFNKMSSTLPKLRSTDFVKILKGGSKALRELKKVDPQERYVLLYPDSENAYIGMGFNLLNIPTAEEVFIKANEILKKDLMRLCLKGPKSELLSSLENRQLATYVTSHATMAKLSHENPHVIPFCKAAGGIGVGFINSLVFSGALSFEDGLDLVQRQAQAMDRASRIVPSGKIIVRVRPATRKRKMCQAAIEHCLKQGIPHEIAVCSVTKQSHAHVIEIAGHEEAIRYLEQEGPNLLEFRDIKRVVHSPYAYHTELMGPARDFLRIYINQRLKENFDYLKEPSTCSVYSATTGSRLRSLESIKFNLYNYPVKPLQVEQLLHCLFARPRHLAQPNTLVLWDRNLLENLSFVNRRAWNSAKLLKA